MIKEQLKVLFIIYIVMLVFVSIFGSIFYQDMNIRLATCYLFLELIYSIFFRYQRRISQAFPQFKNVNPERRKQIINHFLLCLSHFGDTIVRGWFFNCQTQEIYRGNLVEQISSLFYYKTPIKLNQEEKQELDDLIQRVEHSLDIKFPEGYNQDLKLMNPLYDNIPIDQRPLFVYIGIHLLDYFCRWYMIHKGYSYKQSGIIRYYYKQGNIQNKQPLVYIHGLGFGVIFNMKLIFDLQEDREMFIIELPWVSSKFLEPIPEIEQVVESLEMMLVGHGLDQRGVCVIGHSYGTIVTTWLLNSSPQLIKSMVLIEPATLLLFSPKVCYNFLYRKLNQAFPIIARYFVAREISTALSLTRKMRWQDSICLYEQFPPYSTIFLSESDFIVDSNKVQEWIKICSQKEAAKQNQNQDKKKVNIIYSTQTPNHGFILINSNQIKQIRDQINDSDKYFQAQIQRASKVFPRKSVLRLFQN